jgi:thioredoxin reductase (NADPH)
MENVIIIGSGPSGHTAAIYAARAGLAPLMYEGMMAGGVAAGGQLTTTTEVENFPGFPGGISGPVLMKQMREQSTRHGTRIRTETVERVDLSRRPFRVFSDSGEMAETRALIIATGAIARRMNIPGEDRFWQKGISACAVCDGALPVFRQKVLVVVGGGDTAVEEATHLTKYASKVILMHRRDELRASQAMQERIKNDPRVEIMWSTVPLEACGDKLLSSLRVKNLKTSLESDLSCGGLFYAIGHLPNTQFLEDQLKLDGAGYIVTSPGTTMTSVTGVFACGDVQDKRYRQAVTSAGSGCMAALDAERFLIHEAQ